MTDFKLRVTDANGAGHVFMPDAFGVILIPSGTWTVNENYTSMPNDIRITGSGEVLICPPTPLNSGNLDAATSETSK